MLSPRYQVQKKYLFTSEYPLSENNVQTLISGVDIGDFITKPAELELQSDRKSGVISITEGKFHQIKRMFEAVGNKITFLERIEFGALKLDANLARGQWRLLTDSEIESLTGIYSISKGEKI